MPGDILNHQPALSTTTLPGTWLIDLPHDPVIQVRRYHIPETDQLPGNGKDDPLEKAWRSINSSGGSEARSILGGACAIICSQSDMKGINDTQNRELWVFQAKGRSQVWDSQAIDFETGLLQGK
jgi:hypothetical protein